MKLLFDLFPIILFFLTYKLAGGGENGTGACAAPVGDTLLSLTQEPIFLATAVAIGATFLQVGWLLLRRKKVDTMLWVSLAIITIFGGATLYLRDPTFIQWKPTILYWLFALAFLVAPLFNGRNLTRGLLSSQLPLPEHFWVPLNLVWVSFFALMGVANLAAMHWLSCSGWVNFKVYGISGMMFVFILAHGIWLNRYLMEPLGTSTDKANEQSPQNAE